MRLTIPRSQGKQAYYDARKSSWGDIFPHEPKNPPQVKYTSSRGSRNNANGSDIGKGEQRRSRSTTYEKLNSDIKDAKKQRRQERLRRAHEDDL